MCFLLGRVGRVNRVVPLAILFTSAVLGGSAAWADPPENVVRIEEDWELVIGTPNTDSTAPQIVCVMSANGSTVNPHAMFTLNHHSEPDFVPGGLQIQVWQGEQCIHARSDPSSATLSQANETVRWTQVLTVDENGLGFEVVDGTSTTWGNFGGQGYLKAIVDPQVNSLSSYTPDFSVSNSGVGYAANRVQSLVLRRIRYVTSSGDVYEDSTARTVVSNP
jgi:hypothetical protein